MVSIALAAVVAASVPVAAATIEYDFSVPYEVRSGPTGASSNGAGAGRVASMSVSCAVGPASLGFSTATGSASNATGTGKTDNVTPGKGTANVVVTVDGEPRADRLGGAASGQLKSGAGGLLQPVQPNGFYTCWATFQGGQTPVNFLPTTALPKVALKAAGT